MGAVSIGHFKRQCKKLQAIEERNTFTEHVDLLNRVRLGTW